MSAALSPAPLAHLRSLKPAFVLSMLIVMAVLAMALLGPPLLGLGNDLRPTMRLRPPGSDHWFGTDNLGRDIFVRTISGARNSIVVGVATALLTLLVGGALGLLSGYFSWLDRTLMRISTA